MKRFKFEYLEHTDFKDEVIYRILFGTEVLAQLRMNKEKIAFKDSINKKIEFIESFCINFPDMPRKKALKTFADIDETMMPYYKSQFPHGGNRGGGRPVGSTRTDKTERINLAVTFEEKVYLKKCLEEYRSKHS